MDSFAAFSHVRITHNSYRRIRTRPASEQGERENAAGNENCDSLERAINAAASQAGIDPSDMKAALAKAMDGYGGQATEFLTERGVDPDPFYRWAKTNHPTDYKAALIGHVQDRNVAAWGPLPTSTS